MATNKEFSAFPISDVLYGGLTKREYFAASAMTAILSNCSAAFLNENDTTRLLEIIKTASYEVADAMLEDS